MKKTYQKYGVAIVCCFVVLTTSACSSKASSKKDNKTSYVIQEILATNAPEGAKELKEESGELMIQETAPSDVKENGKKDIAVLDHVIASDESSASAGGIAESTEPIDLGSVYRINIAEEIDIDIVQYIKSLPAGSNIGKYSVNAATLAECFTSEEISPTIFDRMENKSYSEGCTTEIKSLRYVKVLHYGFDEEIYVGELVVNRMIEKDILDIFKELFDEKYPIEKMLLIDEYDADDILSMEDNNTSCFNFRMVEGTTSLSNHAYGLAIDLNPLYNPYVRTIEGKENILPRNGVEYADRNLDCKYYIKKDDVAYKIFKKYGFSWGGDWSSPIDYQHFQKVFQ